MTIDEMEAGLRARLEALPPAARAELLHVLMLPDFERADRIGEFAAGPSRDALVVAGWIAGDAMLCLVALWDTDR